MTSRIYELAPNDAEALDNVSAKATNFDVIGIIMEHMRLADRQPGPTGIDDVSAGARRRWKLPAATLPEGSLYRPPTLNGVAPAMNAIDPTALGLGQDGAPLPIGEFTVYRVQAGDNLTDISKRLLGDASRCEEIFQYNSYELTDPDHIYVCQTLRIPK